MSKSGAAQESNLPGQGYQASSTEAVARGRPAPCDIVARAHVEADAELRGCR
jgi:hypothetical protein